MTTFEVDVRKVPKPKRHPLIFDRFAGLAEGESFVLVNSHDPRHLREEFERNYVGRFAWVYLESGPDTWRVQIGRSAIETRPSVLCNAHTVTREDPAIDATGAVWKLDMTVRHLDANIIRLQPGGRIRTHLGPDLDRMT